MSYIVKIEDKCGKYCVTHTHFPGVKASGDNLYLALEAFDEIVRDQKVTKATKHTERCLIQEGEIIA